MAARSQSILKHNTRFHLSSLCLRLLIVCVLLALKLSDSSLLAGELTAPEPYANKNFGSEVHIYGNIFSVFERNSASIYLYRYEDNKTSTLLGSLLPQQMTLMMVLVNLFPYQKI